MPSEFDREPDALGPPFFLDEEIGHPGILPKQIGKQPSAVTPSPINQEEEAQAMVQTVEQRDDAIKVVLKDGICPTCRRSLEQEVIHVVKDGFCLCCGGALEKIIIHHDPVGGNKEGLTCRKCGRNND